MGGVIALCRAVLERRQIAPFYLGPQSTETDRWYSDTLADQVDQQRRESLLIGRKSSSGGSMHLVKWCKWWAAILNMDHITIHGCDDGSPYQLVVGGGRGTLKQVSGGGVRYYPPSRWADPHCRQAEDELEITIRCAHGTEAKARLKVRIIAPDNPSNAPLTEEASPPQDASRSHRHAA